MHKVIAIDFDGTLFDTEYPTILGPRMHVIRAALREQQAGAELILWTCREGKLLEEAVRACAQQGLVFDAVNDSTPEWKTAFGNSPRKVGATEYWDDRAVNPATDERFREPEQRRSVLSRQHISRRNANNH